MVPCLGSTGPTQIVCRPVSPDKQPHNGECVCVCVCVCVNLLQEIGLRIVGTGNPEIMGPGGRLQLQAGAHAVFRKNFSFLSFALHVFRLVG